MFASKQYLGHQYTHYQDFEERERQLEDRNRGLESHVQVLRDEKEDLARDNNLLRQQ